MHPISKDGRAGYHPSCARPLRKTGLRVIPIGRLASQCALIVSADGRYEALSSLLGAFGVSAVVCTPAAMPDLVERRFDIVVLDGLEEPKPLLDAVTAAVEAEGRAIAIVAEANPGLVCDLYRAGAAVVFNRSVDPYHVFMQCCAFLQIWHVQTRPVRVGAALFEMEQRRLLMPDKGTVHLTEAEAKILGLLHSQRDEYVSREEISQTVFKIAYDKFDRRIDVHVSNLRKKLRQNDVGAIIDTSRLNGFRLMDAPPESYGVEPSSAARASA